MKWTQAEIDRAVAMHAAGASNAKIGAAVGRSREAVYHFFWRRELLLSAVDQSLLLVEPRPKLSAEQITERERRIAARDQRSLTAELMGDPPPGFSELDRRLAAGRP